MHENKWGRPTKMTKVAVQKLKEAFKLWSTTQEACSYAKISKTTFYDWKKKDIEFSDEIDNIKVYLTLQCKITIAKKIIDWDVKTSIWYLERKAPKEFNLNYIEEEKEDSPLINPMKERMLEIRAREEKRELQRKKDIERQGNNLKKKKIIIVKKK